MARGREMRVTVTPSSGSARSYRFSLNGFSKAYRRIAQQCGFDVAGILENSGNGGSQNTATASAETTLDTFQNWAAVTWTRADKTTACSADNTFRSKAGDGRDLFLNWNSSNPNGFLVFLPRDKSLGAADRVAITIDGVNFNLSIDEDRAYAYELSVIRAMAAGREMRVTVTPSSGSARSYRFSLYGFSAAYRRIGRECGFDVAGVLDSSGSDSSENGSTTSAETTLDTFQNWVAVTWTRADKTIGCSADNTLRSRPDDGPDIYVAWSNSSEPYGFLAFAPRDRSLDAADRVAIAIDGTNFDLFVDENRAFNYSESALRIIQAMGTGREMIVAVRPSSGSTRSYRFSLNGFTDAYHRIGRHCAFDTAWLTQQMPNAAESQTPEPVELTLEEGQVTQAMRNEHRVALVIGNAAYGVSDPENPLSAPPNDAQQMADLLQSLGFQVQTVIDADLTAFNRAVGKFNEALSHGGVGAFFYSGHGMQINDENFLIPIGATSSARPTP